MNGRDLVQMQFLTMIWINAMGIAAADGEGIASGISGIPQRLLRSGTVFLCSGNRMEYLALHHGTVGMGIENDFTGFSDVFLIGVSGAVQHNGRKTVINTLQTAIHGVSVIQMKNNRNLICHRKRLCHRI